MWLFQPKGVLVSWSRTLKVRQMLRAQLEMGEPIALLFSDIRGFSTYAVRRGDRAAFQLTQLHEGILKDRISEFGILVKSLGDGVMAAFESSSLAVQAGVAIQSAFRERNAARSAEPIDVGIGISAGTPVMTDIDFIGHSVNLAQRLSGLAKSGQILVPSQLAAHTRLPQGLAYIPVGDRMLKGLGSYSLSEVAWMGEAARVSDSLDQVTLVLTDQGSLVVALAKDAKQELRDALDLLRHARAEEEGAVKAWLQRIIAGLAMRLVGTSLQAMGIPRELDVRDVQVLRRGSSLRVKTAQGGFRLGGIEMEAAQRFVDEIAAAAQRLGKREESESESA